MQPIALKNYDPNGRHVAIVGDVVDLSPASGEPATVSVLRAPRPAFVFPPPADPTPDGATLTLDRPGVWMLRVTAASGVRDVELVAFHLGVLGVAVKWGSPSIMIDRSRLLRIVRTHVVDGDTLAKCIEDDGDRSPWGLSPKLYPGFAVQNFE